MILVDKQKSRRKAEAFLLLITLIWGGTFVIVKGALIDASPLLFLGIRFSLAAILFTPFIFKFFHSIDKNVLIAGLFLGLLLFIGFATQTIGLKYTTASKSGFITGMLVVFTPLLQFVIEKRVPRLGNLIGVVLVVIGLYLLTSPEGASFNIGDALTLICAFFFALYIVYIDVYSKRYSVTILTYLQFLTVAGLSFLLAFSAENVELTLSGNLLFSLAYTGILATLGSVYIQTHYQRYTTPTRAAIIYALEPVFAAILAYIVLFEIIGSIGVVGGGLIVLGLITSELSEVIEKLLFPKKGASMIINDLE